MVEKKSQAVGSENKPMVFRNHVYKKSDGGKGANPRPGVYTKKYRDNWDAIFGKSKGDKDADKEES
jgi:hypothetical protein